MSKILFIEGHAGASGDMILSALLDLGFPIENLRETLSLFSIPLDAEKSTVNKSGIRATSIQPKFPKAPKKANGLEDFLRMINGSKLSATLREKSTDVFRKLAQAEGQVHGKKPGKLHFHELGGWDTLVDIVGCLAGFEHFNPAQTLVGPLNVGAGTVQGEHGTFPVPVPAVLRLLTGFPIYSSEIKNELVTPTGAALLGTLGKPSATIPLMELEKTGYGAGSRDLSIPNVLRILLGASVVLDRQDAILKLETNLDDMNPQFWEHIFEELYEAGALEVFLTPVVMKKCRPAHVLTVLAPPEKEKKLTEILFLETTTLGIRREIVSRTVLNRKMVEVSTPYGKIPCKVGYRNGTVFNVAPEYEAMKILAKAKKIPLKEIYQSVLKEYQHEPA